MKKTTLLVALLVLSAVFACEDEPNDCLTCGGPPPPVYLPLTTRSAVLNNLEEAYRRMQITKYQELLDQNFVFYFHNGDVGGGVPAQWGRVEETDAHAHLFDKSYVDNDPSDGIQEACKKIAMDVKWEDGVQWQQIDVNGEDWYIATIFYNFQFDIGADDHFVNNPGAKAQFTVRNAGTDEAPHWQLVEMRDLGGSSVATTAASTDQASWGHVKGLYR